MDETSILPIEAAPSLFRPRPTPEPHRWLGERLTRWLGRRGVFDEFAERLATASTPTQVRSALALAATRLAGGARPRFDREAVGVVGALVIPLRFAGQLVGTLRLVPERPRAWPERLAQRLDALATLAAAAELALDRPARPTPNAASETSRDPVTGLHSASFFDSYLVQTVALANRRREPLTLLAIAPDGLAELRRYDGPEFADAAIALVARAIVATLRASDLVARLDDNRLAIVLLGATKVDARRIAEVLRRAIAEAGVTSAAPAALTASLGLATLPDDARNANALRAAATSALEVARRAGGDRMALARHR